MRTFQHAVERWTSRSLKTGVWLSGAVMVAGLFMYGIRSFAVPIPERNPSIAELVQALLHGSFDPFTLMYLGLVLLMLTPFFRVLTAIVGFAAERDRKFTLVSSAVFVLLIIEFLYSLYR